MKASRKLAVVVTSLVVGFAIRGVAQTLFETHAFSDANLIAGIFAPPPPKPGPDFRPPLGEGRAELPYARHEFHLPHEKPPIPENWNAFEKQFAREEHKGQPSLQLLENGLYQVNQTLYS